MGPGGQSAGEEQPLACGPTELLSQRKQQKIPAVIPALTNLSSPLQQPFATQQSNSCYFTSLLAITSWESRPLTQLQILVTKNSKLQVILISGKAFCHEGKVCGSCRAAGFLQTIYPSRLRSEIFQSTSAIKYSGKKELLLYCDYLLNSQGNWDRTCCPPHLTAVGFKSWFASTKSFTIKTKELLWKALKK